MRRIALWLLVPAVLIAAVIGLYFVPRVQDMLFERAVSGATGLREDLLAPDAMRVLLCGTRGPLPHASRAETCVAVFAGGRMFIVDAGIGSWNNLARWRVPAAKIGAVFLTHLHSDHIGELGELNMNTWIAGRAGVLRVFGPEGVQDVTHGFNVAYTLDRGYRTAHHGAAIANPATAAMTAIPIPLTASTAPMALVYDEGGVRVLAFLVDHAPAAPAFGYRFDYGGRSLVISGDTRRSKAVERMANNVDVLVHEAIATHMLPTLANAANASGRAAVAKILKDIPDYHTTPTEAAEVANAAKVKLLVLYHLVPAPANDLTRRIFMRGVADIRSGTLLGDDGSLITLPVRSQLVQAGHI